MKKGGLLILLLPIALHAQLGKDGGLFKDVKIGKIDFKKHLFVHGTMGNNATNLGIQYRFGDSKKSKIQVLVGVRSIFQSAVDADFITAPGKFRVGSNNYLSGLGKPNVNYMDTIRVNDFRNIALNGYASLGIRLFDVLGLRGFVEGNADIAGVNFGNQVQTNGTAINTIKYNLINGGAHDIGNLNYELLFRFGFDKISVHMGYGWNKRFIQAPNNVQNLSNGSNDLYRFTTKNTVFGLRYRI